MTRVTQSSLKKRPKVLPKKLLKCFPSEMFFFDDDNDDGDDDDDNDND